MRGTSTKSFSAALEGGRQDGGSIRGAERSSKANSMMVIGFTRLAMIEVSVKIFIVRSRLQ